MFHAPLERRTIWEDGEREIRGTEMWANTARGVARLVSYRPGTPESDVIIVAAGQKWMAGEPVPGAAACPGLSMVATVVLGCDPQADRTRARVEEGTFSGDPVVVLITDREHQVEGGIIERSVLRTYLSADTFLPLGVIEEGVRIDDDARRTFVAKSRYAGRSFAATTFSDSLFDPAAKEIKPVPSEEPVDSAPVYWLGERYDTPHPLPSLVLGDVERPGTPLPYTVMLRYAEADRPTRGAVLTIQQLTEVPLIDRSNRPCPAEPVQIEEATTLFYCKQEGGVFAVVSFPDRDLLLDAPGFETTERSPYATRAALSEVIATLRSLPSADDLPSDSR